MTRRRRTYTRLTDDDVRLMRELRQHGEERLAEIEAQIRALHAEWRKLKHATKVVTIADKFGCDRGTASAALRDIPRRRHELPRRAIEVVRRGAGK